MLVNAFVIYPELLHTFRKGHLIKLAILCYIISLRVVIYLPVIASQFFALNEPSKLSVEKQNARRNIRSFYRQLLLDTMFGVF